MTIFVLSQQTKSEFIFSSKTYQEYNRYLTAMVGCLWTSKPFQKGSYIDPEVFKKVGVAKYKKSLNLVHHPALLSYAVSFLLQVRIFKGFLDFIQEYQDGRSRKCHKFSVSPLQNMFSHSFFFEYPLNFGRCGRVSDSKKNSNGVHIKCVDDTTRWDYKYIDRFWIQNSLNRLKH